MALTLRKEEARLRALLDDEIVVLERLRREVTASGARFVVVIIPDEYQVDAQLQHDVARRTKRSLEEYDLDIPQRLLRESLHERNIEFVDLLPKFRLSAETQRLYRPRDTHWNPAGNQLAAEILLENWDAELVTGVGVDSTDR